MKKQENDQSETKELRQKAEVELMSRKLSNITEDVDNLKLMHELQVHKIELEMQNEELVKAREQAESAMEKYVDLYDFAPSGYLTLSEEREITDLNFSAATMLGKDRSHLKNTRFGLYISHESLESFNDFFDEIFRFKQKRSCELLLQSSIDKPCYVHIDALVSQNTNNCLLTMFDITERKKMELELQKSLNQYKSLNSYFLERELRMIDLKKEINELLVISGCEKEYLI
jgi:PAS domain-containing protein